MNRYFLFYFILSFFLNDSVAQEDANEDKESFEISQFTDEELLERCRSDLLEIDDNNDLKLDREEYSALLELQTSGELAGGYKDLPFRVETVYLLFACWCDVVDPKDKQCCINGKDHIPLNERQSPLVDPYLNFFCTSVQEGLIDIGLGDALSPPPSAVPSMSPTASPTLSPSPPPTGSPTVEPTMNPTNNPSATPSDMPSDSPSIFMVPSTIPTVIPSQSVSTESPTAATDSPSVSPLSVPSFSPSSIPTDTPSLSPTVSPPPTLCVDFQYVVRNQVGLDAEDIMNGESNNVVDGLKIATRNITIDILNGTYPPTEERKLSLQEDYVSHHTLMVLDRYFPSNLRGRSVDGELVRKAAVGIPEEGVVRHLAALQWDKGQNRISLASVAIGQSDFETPKRQQQRKLAYYTDEIPVSINSVTDNPLCAGSTENPQIRCAIISSTVCVVLEENDEPSEVRALMINGLRQAVESGDFLRRVPAETLTMGTG